MTTPLLRRMILPAVAAAFLLLSAVLPALGQGETAEEAVRLERTVSTAHALPGSTFRVTLKIEPLSNLEGVGVREVLPLGWAVQPVETDGAAYKRSEDMWVFPERLTEGSTIVLVYEVTVPPADRLYADTLPTCFEITGTFQSTVPGFEIPIPGDTSVEISSSLPIPEAVAHLIPASPDGPDTIDLRLNQRISLAQLNRALEFWSMNAAVPWTEGEIIDLPMMEKLTGIYEVCLEVDEPLPLSIDPELVAVRTLEAFLPCDSVLLPEGCLDPGLSARQFSVTVEISGSHDAYGIGLAEYFPETWRVTPVKHPGFVYRPSHAEWIYPDRLPKGETISVEYLVEVVASTIDTLSTYDGCCGTDVDIVGFISSGLECSERDVLGESEAYVWNCLPVLLAISRWDVEEDRLDATLSDVIAFPQVQRALEFWLSNSPVPHTCGYTVGYHMLKRIVAYWLAGVPVTQPLPDAVASACDPDADDCYAPTCPVDGLCHLNELQRVEDYVGLPDPPRLSLEVTGVRELTCAAPSTTLHVTVQGGTPPYRFEWRGHGGQLLGTSDSLTVTEPGAYSAVAVMVGGCRVGQQIVITQDIEAPQLSIDVGDVLDCAVREVVLTASVLGGRPPFVVRWYNEAGALLGTGTTWVTNVPGRFTVVAEGANGCSSRTTAEVLEDLEPPIVDAGADGTLTCLETEIALDGAASGGRTPYVYRWTNETGDTVGTAPSLTVDSPGTYTLTVTGANGCTGSDSVCIEQDIAPPVVDVAASGPLSCAVSVVTLSATITETSEPVEVSWLGPSGTVIGSSTRISVTAPGTYTVRVRGGNGCTSERTLVVEEDLAAPSVTASALGELTCADADVEVRATVRGGREPYTYEWTNASGRVVSTDEMVAVVEPGAYTVLVTGANGCAASAAVVVHEDNEPPVVEASVSGNLTCADTAVTLSATVSGGRPPYATRWSDADGTCVGTALSVIVDEPGDYTLTVTGANGCAASAAVVVHEDNEPPVVEASVSGDLTCVDTAVTLSATVSAGRTPYTIAWHDADGICISTFPSVVVDQPGRYTVTVTGANACTVSANVVVDEDNQPPIVEAKVDGTLTCSTCEVKLSADISDGRAPYDIAWTNAAGVCIGASTSVVVTEPGPYTVTVTGANGCAASAAVDVDEDTQTPVIETSVPGTLSCAVTAITLSAKISGGRAPFTIAWTDASDVCIGTSPSVEVDRAGRYTVTVSGTNGCTTSATVDVSENKAPPAVSASVDGILTCVTGEVALVATIEGGSEPYTIVWTDAIDVCIGTSPSVVVDEPGRYEVSVTGANGCSGSAAVFVSEDKEPPVLLASADGILTCKTPHVTLDAAVSGGRAPFKTTWRDATGVCIGTSPSIVVDRPGGYTVTVTGANGCTASGAVVVTEDRTPPSVSASAAGTLTCTVSEVELVATVDGGRPPYEILWTDASGERIGTTATVLADRAGLYTVTVHGANGCSAAATVTVGEDVAPPIVDLGPDQELTCDGREILLDAVPKDLSTGPYTYLWRAACCDPVGVDSTLCVREPGTYTVTVAGANGCTATDSITVRDGIEPPVIDLGPDVTLTCAEPKIVLCACPVGGCTGPYVYLWHRDGEELLETSAELLVGAPGTYAATVTDVDGRSTTDSIVVYDGIEPPIVDLGLDRMLTCAEPEIVLFASLSSGCTGPYAYLWQRDGEELFETSAELPVHIAGTYSVTVTDIDGRSTSDSVVVHDGIEAPTVDLGPNRTLGCCGAAIDLVPVVTGGIEPYSYAWYNECDAIIGTGTSLSVTEAGTYLLIVRTVDGCIASDSIVIHER